MLVRNEGAQDDDFPAMESLWEVANLPASLTGLDENLSPGIEKLIISPQAIQLPNQFGRVGYDGPCPSTEERGRYTFMLFALDTHFPEAEMHPLETRWRFIDRHLVARAELSGYFDYTRRE